MSTSGQCQVIVRWVPASSLCRYYLHKLLHNLHYLHKLHYLLGSVGEHQESVHKRPVPGDCQVGACK